MSQAATALRTAVGRSFLLGWRLSRRIRGKSFSLFAAGGFHAFGRRSVIERPIRLSGERFIDIGSGVYIGAGSWLQVIDGATAAPALVIGDGSSLAGGCVLSAARSLIIGKKVLLARNVYIADHMHAYEDATTAVLDQGITRVEPVEVADGAWLGQNVVIGPGVTIGRGAVIGANAVVLDSVPAYSVAVGAPARIVRTFGGGVTAA